MTTKPGRSIIMHRHDENDWSMEWHNHLGWIVYHFAQLEWASFWLAEEIGVAKHRKAIARLPFVERCNATQRSVVPLIDDPSLRHDWKQLLGKMIESAAMRNKILHNPIEVRSDQALANGIAEDQGIMLMRQRGQKILLGEVQAFTNEIMALHTEMIALMKRTSGEE